MSVFIRLICDVMGCQAIPLNARKNVSTCRTTGGQMLGIIMAVSKPPVTGKDHLFINNSCFGTFESCYIFRYFYFFLVICLFSSI